MFRLHTLLRSSQPSQYRRALRSLLLACGLVVLAGCTTVNQSEVSQADFTALSKRVEYLEDMVAIRKLQATYIHSLFTQRFDDIPPLFSRRDDVSVEFSDSGIFRGHDRITELYSAFEATKRLPGFFIMHMSTNPYIEIAEDGMSAKSHWLSPGASHNNGKSSWIWGPYYVNYAKENGEWRIHRSNLVPMFRNPYEYSWGDAPNHGTVNVLGLEPDEPTTLYRPFNEMRDETDLFRDHPDLPAPYRSLD